MFRIKRIKGPPAPATTPPAIHYATEVAKAGNVTRWTADVNKAGTFSTAVATVVKAHYRSRENAGELKLERIDGTDTAKPKSTEVADKKPVAPQPPQLPLSQPK